jgi:hypothetical protein
VCNRAILPEILDYVNPNSQHPPVCQARPIACRILHNIYVGRLDTLPIPLPDPPALDAILVKWQSDESPERPDPNIVVNARGLCFGSNWLTESVSAGR